MTESGNQKILMPLTKITALHYLKLCYRSLLFAGALVIYILDRFLHIDIGRRYIGLNRIMLAIIWIIYAVEMAFRFFPSSFESMGCQKQFARNFVSTGKPYKRSEKQPAHPALRVAAVWIAGNAIIGVLYFAKIFDQGMMVLIALFYGVCDMICILFFCPFQTFLMKNKCCTGCRIYNWDYIMMFTPFIFLPYLFTWTLFAAALALLIRWEVTFARHPERFSEVSNASVKCINCTEKLCHHKKQLQSFLVKYNRRFKDQ